jgi:prenylcysteine oxidase/farnesylcysteine lyase
MSADRTRIVIVGAGVAGASTALRVRDRLGDAVDIVVLEAGDTVGGRAQRTAFAGEVVEVGGTLLHSSNVLVVDLMARLGLEKATQAAEAPLSESTVGIWNGERFVLRTRGGWRFLAALVTRYRLRSLRGLVAAAKDALGRVSSLYPQLVEGRTFASPTELAEAGGFAGLSSLSLADALAGHGVSRRTVDEIGTGIVHNMYNQEPDMAAMPGLAGLVGAGLAGGGLFSVADGNDGLVAGSLRLAAAEVRTGARVVEVRDDRTVVLADGSAVEADIVVLAVPLAVAGIAVATTEPLPETAYRRVHVTLAAGRPSAEHFGRATPPEAIFTTADARRHFNSLARIGWSREHGVPILKFFSLEPLGDDLVNSIIDDCREIKRLEWSAYPIMPVAPETAPFEIAPGVFFPNALEPIVSTLETETIAGRVVGDLVSERVETLATARAIAARATAARATAARASATR